MHHFAYRNGVLHAEAVNLDTLATKVGTPFYCYSTATLERHYGVFAAAFAGVDALVCYAMKANSNQAVIKTLAKLGAGADVVSEGELKRARAADIPAELAAVYLRQNKAQEAMAPASTAGHETPDTDGSTTPGTGSVVVDCIICFAPSGRDDLPGK